MARDLQKQQKLVIVGHGAAGLAAALSAAEQARSRDLSIEITLLEKAREGEAGGNTSWSPSYMRLAAPDRIDPSFEQDMQHASDGLADRNYFRMLAEHAVPTVGWLQAHGVEFVTPIYYLSAGPARIQPVGGGSAIVEKLAAAAQRAGVKISYETMLNGLVMEGHRVCGVQTQSSDGAAATLEADAVILACGGFQGNAAMMRTHFGSEAETLKLISPGTRFDTGDGIRIAIEQGASASGDWNGMHIEPVDPRSKNSAPVVLVYPYGIVVDREGRRFFDEGGGLVHETWEVFARDIHFGRPNSIAYAILDAGLLDIEGFGRAIRSEVPPYRAETLERSCGADRNPCPQSERDGRYVQCRCHRRCGAVRCGVLRRPEGGRHTAAAKIELGTADRKTAVPGLPPGRRHRLHLWRSRHQRQGGSAG